MADETAEERAERLRKALEDHDNKGAERLISKVNRWAGRDQRPQSGSDRQDYAAPVLAHTRWPTDGVWPLNARYGAPLI